MHRSITTISIKPNSILGFAHIVLCGAALVAYLICDPVLVQAQQTKDKWERVYTGEESVIEVNASKVSFQPSHILRVQFRTILSHPETLPGTPGTKYKTRLETIDFKLNQGRYRLFETTLLDSSGKELQSYSPTELQEWRVPRPGGVTERLFTAARGLPPFGTWKVTSYRSADGNLNQARPQELEELIGVRVNLQSNRAEVGGVICSLPAFEDKRSSNEDLVRELGIDLKSIGIRGDSAEMITVSCKTSGWQPPQSLLVKVREGEMLMLWKGVFLVLKR